MTRASACVLGLSLALLMGSGPVPRAAPPKQPPGAWSLPPPEWMPKPERAAVRARMQRHGETMLALMRAVIRLDHSATATLAGRIAEEELLAQVQGERVRLELPEDFFEHQATLRAEAERLAAAASAGHDHEVADAFGALARTCVACHHSYLRGPGPE